MFCMSCARFVQAHAESTRNESVAFGEALAAKRLACDSGNADAWLALHQRCADRLLAMALSNGGIYVR